MPQPARARPGPFAFVIPAGARRAGNGSSDRFGDRPPLFRAILPEGSGQPRRHDGAWIHRRARQAWRNRSVLCMHRVVSHFSAAIYENAIAGCSENICNLLFRSHRYRAGTNDRPRVHRSRTLLTGGRPVNSATAPSWSVALDAVGAAKSPRSSPTRDKSYLRGRGASLDKMRFHLHFSGAAESGRIMLETAPQSRFVTIWD